jgi:ABC-type branched-subunit amino acid transport system permease subunit
MSTYLLFFLLGLGGGSVYAILGLGLVLKYRAAGVVDFAQGAVAMYGAYVFIGLRTTGTLQLPWIVLPHQVNVSAGGLPAIPALAITLAYGAVLGAVLYVLVYRPLLRAAPLTKVCASVGVMLALEAIAVLNFGTTGTSAPSVLPSGSFQLAGIVVPVSQLFLAGIVIVLAAGLAVTYRYSRFGLATRAGAENDVGAALIGLSANRVAAQNWVLASVLATLSGVLIAPISQVDPTSYTLFVVPALGVALVGRFSSFGVTAGAGLLLGVIQSELVKLQTVFTWLPQQGLGDGVPFILILVVMTLSAQRLRSRGLLGSWRNPSIGRPARPAATAALTLAAGLVAMYLLHGSDRVALMASAVSVCLCLSLVVLTGYVGQVSLAQMSFAGISAIMLSRLSENWGVPFPFSLLLAALAAVPVGLLIGLPALRVRGVNLAVITLAAAAAMDALVFNPTWFSGGLAGRTVPAPTIFGLNLGVAGDSGYPRFTFGALLLVIVTLVGLSVARMRNSATGRMLIAVRSNERAAAAAGIRVAPAKLFAFALSAFIAGLAGGLLGYLQGTASAPAFATFTSLSLLAIAYVAGIGRVAGAVIAGLMFAANGLLVNLLNEHLSIGQYQTIVAGIALAFTAIKNPDGVASELASAVKGPGRWLGTLRDRVLPPRPGWARAGLVAAPSNGAPPGDSGPAGEQPPEPPAEQQAAGTVPGGGRTGEVPGGS